METKIDKLLATATRIAELKNELAAKQAEFQRLAGVKLGWTRPAGRPGGDNPISQQVLKIVASGPKTRGEIIEAVGGHAGAVTSALKKHKGQGKLLHKDGRYGLPPASSTMVTPVQVRKGTPSK